MSWSVGWSYSSVNIAKTSRENCLGKEAGGSKWLQNMCGKRELKSARSSFYLSVTTGIQGSCLGLYWRHIVNSSGEKWLERGGMAPNPFFFFFLSPPWSFKTLWPKKTKQGVPMVGNAKLLERVQQRCWGQTLPLSTAIRTSIGRFYLKHAARKLFFVAQLFWDHLNGEVLAWVLGCS